MTEFVETQTSASLDLREYADFVESYWWNAYCNLVAEWAKNQRGER